MDQELGQGQIQQKCHVTAKELAGEGFVHREPLGRGKNRPLWISAIG
jgi:hypothetical protein